MKTANYRYQILLTALAAIGGSKALLGACSERTHGPIVIQAEKCSIVDPRTKFAAKDSLPPWVLDMDKAAIARFLATYRGVLITGSVKKSSAVNTGLLSSSHALKGAVITVFSPGQPNGCATLLNNPIQGRLEEQCCDGGGDAPCLLSQKYILNEIKVAAAVVHANFKMSEDYKKGKDFFRTGKFPKAVQLLKKAYKSDQLDLSGKWILASAAEAVDDCDSAIQPLGDIEKSWVQGDTTGPEDKFVGPAMLLLARCLSRASKAAAAVDALNLLLEQPQTFPNELRTATHHRDFSWINSSEEYRNFVINAKRALGPAKK